MRIIYLSLLLGCLSLLSLGTMAEETLQVEKKPDGIYVYIDNILFTHYRTVSEAKYPYFYPVNGPASGASVTTESALPYPHHQSLFFGCDRVNGGNYWQDSLERGQIKSQNIELITHEDTEIAFKNECLWVRDGAEAPFRDHRTIRITAPSKSLRFIDFEITLEALIDVEILNNNHALFAARVVPQLSVVQGGTLLNANGKKEEEGTFGDKAPWCDYSGERFGITEGIAIFTHPDNPWYPDTWFTRNYGFFSPTPMNWLEDGEMNIAKGETLNLKYRVVIHEGNTEEAKIDELYDAWSQTSAEEK